MDADIARSEATKQLDAGYWVLDTAEDAMEIRYLASCYCAIMR